MGTNDVHYSQVLRRASRVNQQSGCYFCSQCGKSARKDHVGILGYCKDGKDFLVWGENDEKSAFFRRRR